MNFMHSSSSGEIIIINEILIDYRGSEMLQTAVYVPPNRMPEPRAHFRSVIKLKFYI